jgi:transposase
MSAARSPLRPRRRRHPEEIYAEKAAWLLAKIEPESAVAAARAELAAELLDDLRRVDRQLSESKKRLQQVVAASTTTTVDIFGVGPVVAATVVGVTGDIARYPTRDRFAAFNGTAPIEVSSGGRKVWRLSRRGNRTLNHAIHMAAVTQIRFSHSPGRGYYDRKIAEGKTPKEAMRALKRRLSDALWAAMVADARRAAATTAAANGGSGRATGERLCRQRGRLTPRYTGSSAKPLPDPDQGYDHRASPASRVKDAGEDRPKNCLTSKEDSICS